MNYENRDEAKGATLFCGETFYEAPIAQGNDKGFAQDSSANTHSYHAFANKYS